MKRIHLLWILCLTLAPVQAQQYFYDNFESYTAGNLLGPQSPRWTTWSQADGGSEDCLITNAQAYSGNNSMYIESAGGNGPQDVVLDFGGVNSSGRFKYTHRMKIPSGKNGYFNFQGGAFIPGIWALELYFYNGGSFSGTGINGTFPHNQWFEFTLDANLDTDTWQILINGVVQGTFTNTNNISYIDIFPASANSEFYIDDVSYCTNKGCNPELELSNLQISPSTVCTYDAADVSVTVKNNSTFTASSFVLGLRVGNTTTNVNVPNLNLAGGASTTINLPGAFASNVAGAAILVKAINQQGDMVASNDTAATTITVNPSPSLTQIIKGTPYVSARPNTDGTLLDPDIVAAGDVLTYGVVPPTGYVNAGYGSTWTISGFTVRTSGGATVPASAYTFTAPSGSTNAKFDFSPTSALTDSGIVISFSAVSLANGCDSLLRRYINVVPKPDAGYTFTNVCDKQIMPFANTSTISSGYMDFMWDFGDGTFSVLQNPTHLYAAHGTYQVKLYATSNYGYVDSSIQTVSVFELPTADFSVLNSCQGAAVQFTDASLFPTGTPIYDWDFGDATSSIQANPSHLYATPDLYEVTLTVTINGCSDDQKKYATYAPRAVVNFTAPNGLCNDNTISFTNTTTLAFGTMGYNWDFGDGTNSSVKNPTHTFGTGTTSSVKLVVSTDLGCTDSFSKNVTTIEAPTVSFSIPNPLCERTVVFTNSSTEPVGEQVAYTWDFGDGGTSGNKNVSHTFLRDGQHTITLTSSATNGCDDVEIVTITIDEKPRAGFVAADVCQGNPVEFRNSSVASGNLTYKWDFDNGNTSTQENEDVQYSASGAYDVSLIVSTANGCSDTVVETVNVNPMPANTIVSISTGNKGDGSMAFEATIAPNSSYMWFFGDGMKEPGTTTTGNVATTHKYTYDANFQVVLHVTKNNCTSVSNSTAVVFRTGLGEVNGNSLRVYPNPGSGMFNLDLSAVSGELQSVEVYTISGQLLSSTGVEANGNTASLDLTSEPAGVYVIKVLTSEGVYSARVSLSK